MGFVQVLSELTLYIYSLNLVLQMSQLFLGFPPEENLNQLIDGVSKLFGLDSWTFFKSDFNTEGLNDVAIGHLRKQFLPAFVVDNINILKYIWVFIAAYNVIRNWGNNVGLDK